MDPQTDKLVKLRVSSVLDERNARVAAHIIEVFHLGLSLIDEQRPPVLEAIIEYLDQEIRSREKRHPRSGVCPCIREYARGAMVESRKRERRLYYGITGEDDAEPGGE